MLHLLETAFAPLLHVFQVGIYYPFLNILRLIIVEVPGHNAFWGILGLTLLVRFALIAPSRKAAQSQRLMNQLQPQLSELKAEYGDDKLGYASAQSQLFKTNGINPAASCLPILIQLPLLIVLYQAILNGLGLHAEHIYSWVPALPYINTHFLWLNLTQPDPFYILLVLVVGLQFIQVRMVMPPLPPPIPGQQPDASVQAQRQTAFVAPFMYLLIGFKLASGALVYVIITTIFTIVQQYFVAKQNTKLTGVPAALTEGAIEHPENREKFERVKQIVETKQKAGVNVTVRKKK